jgi:hypothetical protein
VNVRWQHLCAVTVIRLRTNVIVHVMKTNTKCRSVYPQDASSPADNFYLTIQGVYQNNVKQRTASWVKESTQVMQNRTVGFCVCVWGGGGVVKIFQVIFHDNSTTSVSPRKLSRQEVLPSTLSTLRDKRNYMTQPFNIVCGLTL